MLMLTQVLISLDLIEMNKGNSCTSWRILHKITKYKNVSRSYILQFNCLQSAIRGISNALPSLSQNIALDSFSFMLVSESFVLKQLKSLKTNKAIGLGKKSEAIQGLSQVYFSCLERQLLNLSVFPPV